ncbi:MAG: VOC family protein [Alphaproteobacteria bacterium]|nr:VOC family protein [Alphaproteobacteria bacterium]MCB9695974.1 VOC family protein [Alphaproteobacteria bacterium]
MRPPFDAAITISCTDRTRSAKFYTEVLGAVLEPDQELIGCWWYRLGPLRISLLPNARLPSPVDRFPDQAEFLLWLDVERDDLARIRAAADAQGGLLQDHDSMVVVRDPDGLLIEVWAR